MYIAQFRRSTGGLNHLLMNALIETAADACRGQDFSICQFNMTVDCVQLWATRHEFLLQAIHQIMRLFERGRGVYPNMEMKAQFLITLLHPVFMNGNAKILGSKPGGGIEVGSAVYTTFRLGMNSDII